MYIQTPRDFARKLVRPDYFRSALRHTIPASAPQVDEKAAEDEPHAGLIIDPIEKLSKATLKYQEWQLRSGIDLLNQGLAPQTAADFQNVNIAQQQPTQAPLASQQFGPLAPDPCAPTGMPFAPGGPGGMPGR